CTCSSLLVARCRILVGRRRRPPTPPLFPYTTLFRSGGALSKRAKIALAMAATNLGTATNSGEAGLLEEERAAADKFIGQYNRGGDRKSTRLNSSHVKISYAVFCMKKNKNAQNGTAPA